MDNTARAMRQSKGPLIILLLALLFAFLAHEEKARPHVATIEEHVK